MNFSRHKILKMWREREGKEFEEHFPHLGRDGILKSPFNRGRRRRFHFVSFATDGVGRDERGEIGWKKAELLLKFSKKRMCRIAWPSNNQICTFPP